MVSGNISLLLSPAGIFRQKSLAFVQMKKTLKRVLIALIAVFVIIQFFRIDKSVPEYNAADDFLNLNAAPAEVAELMRAACYDCHSYETKYPWYANVAPVSWWLKGHIDEGRRKLNYSTFGTRTKEKQAEKIEESGEAVTEGWMPLNSYKWGHPEARLTDAQRLLIGNWLLSLALTESAGEPEEGNDDDTDDGDFD